MFEDYYFDDPELQAALAAAGYYTEPVRTPAVMPSTVQAEPIMGIGSPAVAAPNYLSGLNLSDADLAGLAALNASGGIFNQGNYGSDFGSLDDVYGMNFGSDFGGGLQGGSLYKVNPYLQTLQAPLSDKGNPTAYRGGGIEVKSPTQTFRLLDKNTGQVVYEGVGYEGAQEAIDRASALTAEQGAKAQWQIQTPNSQQESGYSVVANEKRSQSTLGDIASVALPIGMALLTGGMSLPAQMAGAAMAGAAGAGLAGKDPLKAGLISAGTAGLGNVSGANEAIGKAVGSVGGTLLGKTAEEVAKQAAAEASGQIVVTGLSKALQGAGSAIGNTLLSQGIKGGLSEVTGFKTPAERFADQPLPEALQTPIDNSIVVSGTRAVPSADALTNVVSGIGSGAASAVINQPAATEPSKTAEEKIEEETGEIASLGKKTTPVNIPVTGIGTPGFIDPITGDIVVSKPQPVEQPKEEVPGIGTPGFIDPITGDIVVSKPQPVEQEGDIVVSGRLPRTTPPPIAGFGAAIPAIIPGALSPTQTGPAPEKSTLDKVKDAFNIASVALPIIGGIAGAGGGGGSGGTISPKGGTYDVNPNRSDTFGTRGIANIGFDPFTYGQATGNQPTEFMFFTRDPVTGAPTPTPITTPVPNQPAAPAMILPSDNTFAEGGEVDDDMAAHLMAYHKNGGHTGPGQVKGIGSGQEDKIAAWLSDGEYVWSAQDVADLGDGSTDEGVRRLDKMRHMVRRRAGRKDVKKIAKPQKGIDHMLKAVGGSK
jgi:hypothetical protein